MKISSTSKSYHSQPVENKAGSAVSIHINTNHSNIGHWPTKPVSPQRQVTTALFCRLYLNFFCRCFSFALISWNKLIVKFFVEFDCFTFFTFLQLIKSNAGNKMRKRFYSVTVTAKKAISWKSTKFYSSSTCRWLVVAAGAHFIASCKIRSQYFVKSSTNFDLSDRESWSCSSWLVPGTASAGVSEKEGWNKGEVKTYVWVVLVHC